MLDTNKEIENKDINVLDQPLLRKRALMLVVLLFAIAYGVIKMNRTELKDFLADDSAPSTEQDRWDILAKLATNSTCVIPEIIKNPDLIAGSDPDIEINYSDIGNRISLIFKLSELEENTGCDLALKRGGEILKRIYGDERPKGKLEIRFIVSKWISFNKIPEKNYSESLNGIFKEFFNKANRKPKTIIAGL